MKLRTALGLVNVGSFLLFGLTIVAAGLEYLPAWVAVPLLLGFFAATGASGLALGLLRAKPALEKIRAALTAAADPALGHEWQHGAEATRSRALSVFTCMRLTANAPLLGDSSGMPARVSYEKLKGDKGGTYLLTFVSVDVLPSGYTVAIMRGPRRPWQSLASDLVEIPDAPAALGGGWRVAASDPSAVDAVITPEVAQALAQSRSSVAAAVWVDSEVTVIEDGNRTAPARLAEMFRLAARISGGAEG